MGYVGTKPADAALTSADIADGVVTADKLATDAVETAKVKDLNVTVAKLPAAVDISTKTVTLPATVAGLGTGIDVTSQITGTIPTGNLGTGTADATTYLAGNQTYKTTPAEYDDDVIQSNIAMLGFKVAVNGSLSRYNLVDQSIDEYFDATGVDSGASTGASRNAAGKYYSGTGVDPTGGTITTHGSYTVHTFLLADTGTDFTPGVSGNVSALVVAGGGGSGYAYGGGGGAGGFQTDATHAVTAQAYTITVGDGGAGKTSTSGGWTYGLNGGDSVFNTITSTGGGGGGGALIDVPNADGRDGGSGGGCGLSGGGETVGAGVVGQGNDGTVGYDAGTVGGNSGGAGGGATASGSAASSGQGGNGGAGTSNDYRTGSGVYYAGGGAGGSGTTPGTGGTGGGGNGSTSNGSAGTDHTGGGGGAGSGASGNGADGGSGIVVIRYTTADFVGVVQDMTLQSTDVTAEAEPDYGELITLIENAAGTATLNTDIKGYVSCDSGVTFAQGTLVDEGTWGTNKQILAFHDLDISSQTGTSMCYKITTHNQSGAKDTRVYATSIGWR